MFSYAGADLSEEVRINEPSADWFLGREKIILTCSRQCCGSTTSARKILMMEIVGWANNQLVEVILQ